MGYRIVFVYGLALLAWTYVCFIELWIYGFNVSLGSFGAAFGLIYGFVYTQWQLKTIEKNGEFRATRKAWVFALLAIIVFVTPALYFVFTVGSAGAKLIFSFMFPILLALYATQIGLFLNWERKQRKHILFEGFILTRVYASPENKTR